MSTATSTSSWGSPKPIQEIAATKTENNKKGTRAQSRKKKGGKQSFDDILLVAMGVRPN